MSQNIAAWYTEKIASKVIVAYQAHGGMLDGTMMPGDIVANTVKFPIAGRTEVYKLTGAIERVPVGGIGLSTVQMQFEDFEAADWWRTQDAYKAGPVEQGMLVDLLVKAVRRKRDKIKIDALTAFANAGGDVTTIGNGTGTIDVLHTEQARAEIAGVGADDEVFCLMPPMWMTQLCFYKEFADGKWVGDENAPFSKTQRAKSRTVRGVTYIECPDEYFTEYSPGMLETFMWAKNAMGAEMPWNQETPSIDRMPGEQGTPYLVKVGLGGAAIGIQGKGVKRIRMSKITAPVRPA